MIENVLVLNANYEPINVCNIRRAVGLILSDKAALILNGRGYLNTINRAYPIPSIIRLQTMVHRPHPKVKLNKREIFRRDNFTCQYCGKHTMDLTIDHVVPRHLGGLHTWENVVAACSGCNHRKGGRSLADSGMVLLHRPAVPPTSAQYIFGRHLHENSEWEPYLNGW